ncbi:MAG: hypothetical protein HQ521_11465 [Bacteroidetes bacterium]|nr:hypothetical protein [Bacteroidota bacterium]
MKTYLFPLISLLSILLITGSCKKDDDSVQTPDIYGSWTVLQTDYQSVQYNVELRFNTDNSYDWILLDTVEGHTNSHAEFNLVENIMIISSDADCSAEGEYYLIKELNKLAVIAITDGCEPRAVALEYLWEKK